MSQWVAHRGRSRGGARRSSRRPLHLATLPDGHDVALSEGERSTHLHIFGASGSGKSRFLEHLILQDIRAGRGVCVLDPHGTLYDRVQAAIALKRVRVAPERVHLFQPAKEGWTFGFNPLNFASLEQRRREYGIESMTKAIAAVWGGRDLKETPRLQRRIRAVFGALIHLDLPLPAARHLLVSKDRDGVRSRMIQSINDPILRQEWEEIEALRPREFNEQFESTQNRIDEFFKSSIIERIFSQQQAPIDTARIMEEGYTLLVDLSSHGNIFHENNATTLGALLVNDLYLKCLARPEGAPPFHLYIDECHRYLTPDVIDILYQARKFGLHLTLAHQDLSQLGPPDSEMYRAVMSGAQTKVVFQVGLMSEAKVLAYERMHGEVDYEKRKRITRKEVVGHEVIRLKNHSDTVGQSDATGHAETTTRHQGTTITTTSSRSVSEGGGVSEGGSETLDLDGEVINTATNETTHSTWSESYNGGRSEVETEGSAESRQVNQTHTDSRGYTDGEGESLKPIIVDSRQVLFTIEEILHSQARELVTLRKRHALVLRKPTDGESQIERIKTPDVPDYRGPKTPKLKARFEQRALESSEYAVEVRYLPEAAAIAREPEGEPLALTTPQQEPENW